MNEISIFIASYGIAALIVYWVIRPLLTVKAKTKSFAIKKMTIEPHEMNEWQKTGVVLNAQGLPFMTLTETTLPNVWYHDEVDCLFMLTPSGFKIVYPSSKKGLSQKTLRKE